MGAAEIGGGLMHPAAKPELLAIYHDLGTRLPATATLYSLSARALAWARTKYIDPTTKCNQT